VCVCVCISIQLKSFTIPNTVIELIIH